MSFEETVKDIERQIRQMGRMIEIAKSCMTITQRMRWHELCKDEGLDK